MTRTRCWFLAAALLALPVLLPGQTVGVRVASLYESYSFKPGLVFNKVTEMTIPIGVDIGFGRLGSLALSTGYANVKLVSADPQQLSNQNLSGMLDTEGRLSLNVVPGKLIMLVTGAIPTGTKTVQQDQLSVLGAISSDVIGFSAANLGSGGNVGGGFVGAVPLGKFSLGLGATYRLPLAYTPVVSSSSLQPGAELRLRAGVEGAASRRTYVRFAGILARSSQDKIGGALRNGVGTRIIGYASVNQGLGPASITVYGFDVMRGSPQVEQTATGAALLPKGNLIAGGLRVDITVAPRTTVAPRFEYRLSAAAPDTSAAATLQRLGSSARFGVDVRQSLSRSFAAVLQAGGVTGDVIQAQNKVPFSGLRAAIQVEYTP
ncbi:MAG: hypothetical protein HY700_16220 [Gemmatimonadetes bacterium]|nr:hypothetical protein [Gemmatimonadota bacterium]